MPDFHPASQKVPVEGIGKSGLRFPAEIPSRLETLEKKILRGSLRNGIRRLLFACLLLIVPISLQRRQMAGIF